MKMNKNVHKGSFLKGSNYDNNYLVLINRPTY